MARTAPVLSRRETLALLGVLLLSGVGFLLPVIPQAQSYHRFADSQAWFGVPNAANVLSNLPFIVVGLCGLWRLRHTPLVLSPATRRGMVVVFLGFLLTGFGSAWYHAAPDDQRLVWDRLPMTLAFAGVIGALFALRISERAGNAALLVMLIAGPASILYWQLSGDLAAYGVVQFGTLALLLAVLLRARNPRDPFGWWWLLGWYALSKVLEAGDLLLWNGTGGTISGHALKHLAAAAGGWVLVRALRPGRPAD